jgi:metallophosphoesterase (TIGR00282 family)
MKVLMIGDIMGEPGRRSVARLLPKLIANHSIDVVVGNGENVAGGFGITPDLVDDLFDLGVSVITTGNHAWDKKEILEVFPREPRLLRPADYPTGVPGRGSYVFTTPGGESLRVHLMGRAFMPTIDCPFQVAKREIERLKTQVSAIVVDMHAEATSEKMAMGHYLMAGDGRGGTHTHVQTADEQILRKARRTSRISA